MATVDEFYFGSEWEQTSGPLISRQVDTSQLWPHGAASEIGGGDKDVLENGLHPILAYGDQAIRAADNLVGVVVTVEENLAQINIAKGFVCRQFVANILTYAAGVAATWAATFEEGMAVYIDDSAELSEGVTLSLSPLNSAGSANPFVGWLFPAQDEYDNFAFGGPNDGRDWPVTADDSGLVEAELTVMLK